MKCVEFGSQKYSQNTKKNSDILQNKQSIETLKYPNIPK